MGLKALMHAPVIPKSPDAILSYMKMCKNVFFPLSSPGLATNLIVPEDSKLSFQQ